MKKTIRLLAAASLVIGLVAAVAVAGTDFGVDRDNLLRGRSVQLFGVQGPIPASSTSSVTAAQANADPTSLATFAQSLSARVVTSGVAAPVIDMLALWPNDQNPEWLIACNEQVEADPGLQRINIATGAVQTIVSGTIFCDAAKRTPWGTIVFTEENGGGATGGIARVQNPVLVEVADVVRGVTGGGKAVEAEQALARLAHVLRRHGSLELRRPPRAGAAVLRGRRHLPERRDVLRRRGPSAERSGRGRILQVRPLDAS